MATPTQEQISKDREQLRPGSSKGFSLYADQPKPALSSQDPQEQQIIQYYRGIFSDKYICGRYTAAFNSDAIEIPPEPKTRQLAMKVAQEVVTNYTNRSDTISQSGDEYYSDDQICAKAAQKFIRKCQAYDRSYSRQNDKQARQAIKQNPGLGTYDASEFVPADPNNKLAIKEAAVKAGNTMAYYDLLIESGDKDAVARRQQAEQYIKPQLNNKMYSTYYLYTYCTKARFQDVTKMNSIKQTLNTIDQQYTKYENEFRAAGDPNKQAINDYDRQKLNINNGGK